MLRPFARCGLAGRSFLTALEILALPDIFLAARQLTAPSRFTIRLAESVNPLQAVVLQQRVGSIRALASLPSIEEYNVSRDFLRQRQFRSADGQPDCPLELLLLRRNPRLTVPICRVDSSLSST